MVMSYDFKMTKKKVRFFWNGPAKIRIFWPIFSDELRCVFPIFMKKKTHPNLSTKITKGAFSSWMNIGKMHLNSSMRIGQNIPIFIGPFRKNATFFFDHFRDRVILGITLEIYIYETSFSKSRKKRTLQNIPIFAVPFQKTKLFFDHFRDRVFLGFTLGIYMYETFFSKSRKKHTFCDFQWRIGVRFFFHEYWKNAPQFVNENRPKYSNFCSTISKKRTFFFDHFRDRVILGITLEIYIYETSFSKSRKKRTFCNFQWRIGVRFFFMNIGKTHLNSSMKIGQNIPIFVGPFRKNAPFFFDHFRDRVILGITLEIYIYETSFSKSRKKRTFCNFQWRIGVRFFFMNIGKTHLNSSLKIGQNIPIFAVPFQKNAPFFFDHFRDRVFLGFTLGIYMYETFFSKSRKKRTFCDFHWRIGVRFFFSWILEKRTSIRHWKSAKIFQFLEYHFKKTHLFFWSF